MYPRIIEPRPTVTELIKNREYWKNKTITFRGKKIVYDQDIRTGICYFCKRAGNPQYSGPTYLHHVIYDNSNPLAWTVEVCGKCHYKVDKNNKRILDNRYGRR